MRYLVEYQYWSDGYCNGVEIFEGDSSFEDVKRFVFKYWEENTLHGEKRSYCHVYGITDRICMDETANAGREAGREALEKRKNLKIQEEKLRRERELSELKRLMQKYPDEVKVQSK